MPAKKTLRRFLFEQLEGRKLLASDMEILRMDVDGDQTITPLDVLTLVNEVNQSKVKLSSTNQSFDIDQDGGLSPLDVLRVINHINGGGELKAHSRSSSLAVSTLLAAGESRTGRSPTPAPSTNDLRFVVDTGFPDLDTSCSYRSSLGDGSIDFEIKVDRFLGDISKLKSAGLVPSTIKLRFPAYDVDLLGGDPPEKDVVYFNGTELGDMKGANGEWFVNEFDVPIELINFGDGNGNPGTNEIKIMVDTLSPPGDDNWCTAIDWASIEIDKAPQPVLLVHGILSNADGWETPWRQGLLDLGIPAEAVYLGSDQSPLGVELDSIAQNATDIAAAADAMKSKYGVDKINIVSHSKGGIDSREYAEYNDSVNRLLQIGTPNGGSPLADAIQIGVAGLGAIVGGVTTWGLANRLSGPAGLELTTAHMLYYNWAHSLNPKTEYLAIAGNYSTGSSFQDAFLRGLYGGANDAIVPLSSVYSVPGIVSISPHGSTYPNESAKHTGQVPSSELFQKLVGVASQPTQLYKLDANGENGPLLGLQTVNSGIAVKGQISTTEIILDGISSNQIGLASLAGPLEFTLVSPSGQVLDDAVIDEDPDIRSQTVLDEAGLWLYSISLSGKWSEAGKWKVNAVLPADSPEQESFYSVLAVTDAEGVLKASSRSFINKVNSDLIIDAEIVGSIASVDKLFDVRVVMPDGTFTAAQLLDDGVFPDLVGGDGVYSVALPVTQAGGHRIAVRASDTAGTFERSTLVSAIVSALSIAQSQPLQFKANDTNENGLYDDLTVTVPLDVSGAGPGFLRAVLETTNGDFVTEVSRRVTFKAGLNSIAVVFPGESIFEAKNDGPYRVRYLRIASSDNAPVAELNPSSVSDSYQFKEFEHDDVLISASSDKGVDANSDDVFEGIEVALNLEVTTSGAYSYTARLEDSAGKEIGFATGRTFVSSSQGTALLYFDAEKIIAHGEDGPYFVRDLFVYGTGSVIISDVHTTRPYKVSDFLPKRTGEIRSLVTNSDSNTLLATKATVTLAMEILAGGTGKVAVIDWGDGNTMSLPIDGSVEVFSETVSHVFESGGVFEITVSLIDQSSSVLAKKSVRSFVQGIRLTSDTLYVVGSSSGDVVEIYPSNGSVVVFYSEKGLPSSRKIVSPSSFKSFQVFTGKGRDYVFIDNRLSYDSQVDGGADDDVLKGGGGADFLMGGDGRDLLFGFAGPDILRGGRGKDSIYGGRGSDRIEGDEEDDVLFGEQGNDALFGGDGSDYIYGGGGNDEIDGGSGSDHIWGGTGRDSLLGNTGNDWLFGEIGDDFLDGDLGFDYLFGGQGKDELINGERNY